MRFFVFILCIITILTFRESSARAVVVYGAHPGYIDSIDSEVTIEPQDMILPDKPESLKGPTFHELVFNDQLSDEFIYRYKQEFGRTEQEENYFLINKQGYYLTPTGLNAVQEDERRRHFAEYVVKRLTEFHTENILKSDPKFRKIYEVKQAVSNVKLEVGPKTRFEMIYSFVGNFLKTTFYNPVADTFINLDMDETQYTPTSPKEIFITSQKPFARVYRGELGYTIYDRALHGLIAKNFTPTFSANISQTFRITNGGIDRDRESLTMLGMNLIF